MQTLFMTVRLMILPIIFFASNIMVHAEPVSGHVKSVLGEATLVTGEGHTKDIEIGTSVESGSRVQTAADGRVVIEWMPGAYSVITPNSNVEVSSLGYAQTADGTPHRKINLDLLEGTVFCHLKHNDGPSSFTVRTPEGVAAARGTDYAVSLSNGKAEVATFTSVVTFTEANGTVIGIKAGVAYIVGSKNAVPMTGAQLEAFLALLKSAGLSVIEASNGGYTVTFTPPGGGAGFSFTVSPPPTSTGNSELPGQQNNLNQNGLSEQPIPSTNFTSP